MNAPFAVDTSRGAIRTDLNRQWMARPHDQRFTSLDDLYAAVRSRADASAEAVVDVRKIEFIAPEPKSIEDIHDLSIGLPGGTEVAPTHWSFGQLCSLGKAPSGYLRTLPSQITADALHYSLRYSRQADSMKLYSAGDELRAATSETYGRIFDHEVVGAVRNIAGDGRSVDGWRIPGTFSWATRRYDPFTPVTNQSTTLYASDRDVFIFLVKDTNPVEVGRLPSGEPDLLFPGFMVSNSEVGSATLRIATFFLRAVCHNRLMIGVEDFSEISIRHTAMAPTRFVEQARPALEGFANGSSRNIAAGIDRAKAALIATEDEKMVEFLAERVGSRKRALAVMDRHLEEEGKPIRSVWDAANGLTAFARDIAYQDERVAIERTAGKMLAKATA